MLTENSGKADNCQSQVSTGLCEWNWLGIFTSIYVYKDINKIADGFAYTGLLSAKSTERSWQKGLF